MSNDPGKKKNPVPPGRGDNANNDRPRQQPPQSPSPDTPIIKRRGTSGVRKTTTGNTTTASASASKSPTKKADLSTSLSQLQVQRQHQQHQQPRVPKFIIVIEPAKISVTDVRPNDIFIVLHHRVPRDPGMGAFHWMFYIHVGDESNKNGEIMHANNSEKFDYYWMFERKKHTLLTEKLAIARRIGKLPQGWTLDDLENYLQENIPVPYSRGDETKFTCRIYCLQVLFFMKRIKEEKDRIVFFPEEIKELEKELIAKANVKEAEARACITFIKDVPHFPGYTPLFEAYKWKKKEIAPSPPPTPPTAPSSSTASSSRTTGQRENKTPKTLASPKPPNPPATTNTPPARGGRPKRRGG